MFCIYLRTNSDLCHLLHKLIGFYNRDEKSLQRGTDWVFKSDRYTFVLRGLKSKCWTYDTSLVLKVPEYGTLAPEIVVFGTWYKMFHGLCFIEFHLVRFDV